MWYFSLNMPVSRVVRLVRALLIIFGRPIFWLAAASFVASLFILQQTLRSIGLFFYTVGQATILFPRFLFIRKRFLLAATLGFLLYLAAAGGKFFAEMPQPGQLLTRDQAVSSKIYDRDGRLLFKIYKNQNRTLVPLSEVPDHVKTATVAIEDAEFYNHHGFSIKGIARSLRRNLARGQLTGGSTITQQLVKNALLSPEKTLSRKLKEITLSIRVELTFTKDQILEMYLNEVSYGGSAYGIEEAAQVYFGRSVRNINLAEAALLAGLPQAPTTYSPFGANPQLSKARQLEVLSRMAQEGFITTQQAQAGAARQLVLAPQRTDISAPHFVMYVRQLLAQKYGERLVEEGGLEVTTSLDLNLQKMTQNVVAEEIKKIQRLNISNGAALITVPATGEVLAMVGSRDYFDRQIDGNFNVTTSNRQPGSAIKPVNYSYALESRLYTPASILSDSPITYQAAGSPAYSPGNYDNKFRGPVTLRTALGSSLNIPAVKALASYGVDKMILQGQKLGITTWENPSRFGLSLTLGGGEVKPVDMAVVYAVLANYGKRVNLKPILKVTDYKGRVLEDGGCTDCAKQVLDQSITFQLTDILRDNDARTPAFGPSSLLVIPNHPEVAVKTGTSQNLRDNWAIGYTKDYVVVTWVGNNNNRPMAHVASGVTGATPIWHKIMANLVADKSSYSWSVPDGLVVVGICGDNGKKEYFLAGTQPAFACIPKPQAQKEEKPEESNQPAGQIL